jgi:hypothetical protein
LLPLPFDTLSDHGAQRCINTAWAALHPRHHVSVIDVAMFARPCAFITLAKQDR